MSGLPPARPWRSLPRVWSPVPAVRASLWAHLAGAAVCAVRPDLWASTVAVLAANHALLACGMHPRGGLIGRNLTALPAGQGAVALTFDDGPDPEVTPAVLDILDAHGARATFFLIGARAARHPGLVREILRRGHALGNHTQRHPIGFSAWGPWRMRREIRRAQHSIAEAGGTLPLLFRAPMGLRNPLLDPVLALEGLSLVSWTRRGYDGVRRDPDRVLARLAGGLAAGDVLLLHDGNAARDAAGRPVVLTVLPRLLDRMGGLGLRSVAITAGHLAPPGAAR